MCIRDRPITISVVPAISAALAKRDRDSARNTMESSIKVTTLFALPAGMGLCVMSYPIFNVLYPGSNENGPTLLAILGIASVFVCIQLITNAILQASGYEKLALLSLPLGGAIKIIANWFMVGTKALNIVGAPIGTLLCYVFITGFNIYFIKRCLRNPPRFIKTLAKPAICTLLMALTAFSVYGIFGNAFGLASSGFGMLLSMAVAILAAIVVYGVSVVATGAITKDDMQFVPKGEKLARILKLK